MPNNNNTQLNEMTDHTEFEILGRLEGADVLAYLEYAEGYNFVTDPSNYEVCFILGHGNDNVKHFGELFGIVRRFWTSFDATEEEASEIAEGLNQTREECKDPEYPEDLKIFATIREN